ncbi:hypothetical protein [Pedobacter sp. MR2016-24]|uniref:hypothetical protein n=1 Tax=Pedobacter sp. MR2016-24 TaxID=2994466 RepID=UPI002247EE12|nr:hypothetical protein [Pedobacter sp. MR2016-24]MCX2484007.1 hypothetical protein [Pedobacter sp. MR2016-24]
MKYLEKIQTLLPLGYLYLIVLGLLKESLLYYPLGINILNYSSITDILISPIADLISKVELIIALIIICLILYGIQTLLISYRNSRWSQKILHRFELAPETSKKEMQKVLFPVFVLLIAIELLSLFVGYGLAGGKMLSKKIINSDYTYNYKLNFNSGKSEDIYVFDSNSSFYFYVTKGSSNIKIVPVASINTIEMIDNPKLKTN